MSGFNTVLPDSMLLESSIIKSFKNEKSFRATGGFGVLGPCVFSELLVFQTQK